MRRITFVLAGLAASLAIALPAAAHPGHCRTHACWHRVHMAKVQRMVVRRIAAITPYQCYGDRFAIPCYYIGHESATAGLWRAENAGGCVGAYQFCGWPVPWPVIVPGNRLLTLEHELAHDRMARKLWAQQLAGHCNWCY